MNSMTKINTKELLKNCFRIRKIEQKISDIYPSDKIQSPVHLSNGQEAVAVGVCQHLKKTDLVFGTYRGHALYLAKGGCLNKMMAELFLILQTIHGLLSPSNNVCLFFRLPIFN